ncbi:tryptophan-rich sensory protein [Fulvivirga lutimaris]|uniref:tryptophan-rich sensory protein n=1 Tax=Fulvivirga lutimaris TaxID=1819566 RepID=UPI0012BD35FD|nr:tryptophan-rich sensory protein [Fulvivirga lutimaris]MTI40306.1 hypothetical protein [Fulvivirga lutimaris]
MKFDGWLNLDINPIMKFKILNTIGFIVVLVTNYLANALPINGYNTGELSDFYPNLFVPTGITFSIWGLIYLLLIGFIILQWVSADKKPVQQIGILFFLNCLLNASWILAWHYRLEELSVIIMLLLLTTLIKIWQTLQKTTFDSKVMRFFTKTPFSIYFGWICVATIANITALLVHWNFNPAYPEYWTAVLILITQILVWLVNKRNVNLAYSLTIIWAISGIVLKQSQLDGPFIIVVAGYIAIAATLVITIGLKIKTAIN